MFGAPLGPQTSKLSFQTLMDSQTCIHFHSVYLFPKCVFMPIAFINTRLKVYPFPYRVSISNDVY